MRKFLVVLFFLSCLSSSFSQSLIGCWNGKLSIGFNSLNLVFHIDNAQTVTMDSPDQGAYQIPTSVTYFSSDSVSVEMKQLGAAFRGKLANGIIKGVFSQGGYDFPLELKPGNILLNRPQNPVSPLPYHTQEVSFKNETVTLGGTLTYPVNFKKGCPVVLLISGSGQQNRDEEIMGHKPFLVLADYLARHGIATLRYDDRGVGQSTGMLDSLTMDDEILDAQSGIQYLRRLHQFGKVGVIGHSEGGTIGLMLASKKKIDFLVSMAGPILPNDSILLMQNYDLLMVAGCDSATSKNYCKALDRVFKYILSTANRQTTQLNADMTLAGLTYDINLPQGMKDNLRAVLKTNNPWFKSFLAFNPTSAVGKINCPVFALGGSKDLQVRSSANLSATKRLLPTSVTKEYSGLNHLFQPCTTGMVTEYSKIETTIADIVLQDIAQWIIQVASRN